MRLPEHLPRNGRDALKVFLAHPSAQIIAFFVVLPCGARLAAGSWKDAALAAEDVRRSGTTSTVGGQKP